MVGFERNFATPAARSRSRISPPASAGAFVICRSPYRSASACRTVSPRMVNRHGSVRWWLGAQIPNSRRRSSISGGTNSARKWKIERRFRMAS